MEPPVLEILATPLLGDVNIDGRNKKSFDKHRLIKAVHRMNFTQIVHELTRPVSGTCLDHIYSNHPQRILYASTLNYGPSDHVPIFAVRNYNKERPSRSMQKTQNIRYHDMKQFDENRFKEALSQAP